MILAGGTLALGRMPTPIGEMLVVVDDLQRFRALDWTDHEDRMRLLLRRRLGPEASGLRVVDRPLPAPVRRKLDDYFAGDMQILDGISVETSGTAFQASVWRALRAIPAGTTISYGMLAARIGRPKAVRAVGLANGANPIGIVVPCHRVIGADASLTGYGGGLERKCWLLRHEGAIGIATREPRRRGGTAQMELPVDR